MSLQIRYCNKVALLTKKCGNKTQFSDFAKLVGTLIDDSSTNQSANLVR